MSATVILLPNYPQPFGTRSIAVAQVQGPLAYQAGGVTINPQSVGFSKFDYVSSDASANNATTGGYKVQVLWPTSAVPLVANNNVQGNPPTINSANSVNLRWTAANGNEVANNTNLSAEFANCLFIGG